MRWPGTPRNYSAIMAFEPLVAVYDSCVLYPFEVRNLLVQFAFDRLVEARWTDAIHDDGSGTWSRIHRA